MKLTRLQVTEWIGVGLILAAIVLAGHIALAVGLLGAYLFVSAVLESFTAGLLGKLTDGNKN